MSDGRPGNRKVNLKKRHSEGKCGLPLWWGQSLSPSAFIWDCTRPRCGTRSALARGSRADEMAETRGTAKRKQSERDILAAGRIDEALEVTRPWNSLSLPG